MTRNTISRKFRACLFDMDGLLINSESKYTEVTDELLAMYGKGPLTWDVKVELQGRPGNESTAFLIKSYDLPISPQEVYDISFKLQESKWPTCEFLPGVLLLLKKLKESGVPMAVATSSYKLNFQRKTSHLKEFDLFDGNIIAGDDSRIGKGRGKPKPDIWLLSLKMLNENLGLLNTDNKIKPEECMVFEDGKPGVLGAIAANCYVIWVPDVNAVKAIGEENVLKIIEGKGEVLLSIKEFDFKKYNFF
ncbi:haloacid dehalogenase superfamily protein [Ascoidea rubescens DSM 1968]|uniref:HAD-like protein n=1 Tax=Ascoidea rubescens DSM 1968 TaxID=1344418 RepID=A0A1D2VKZ7_9ASCO|nr:HAD-like protein [Ascoidea rubescens DSM 1968]ODV62290.1 HAD-like protein [Ascoidea rubescens DSM 1968]